MISKKRPINIRESKVTSNDNSVMVIYEIREEGEKSIKIRITRIRRYVAVTNYNL